MKIILLLLFFFKFSSTDDTTTNISSDVCEKHKKCYFECQNVTIPSRVYKLEEMTQYYRDFILNRLNEFRNDIAVGGQYSAYLPTAANMRTMRWNKEFEYYGGLQVMGRSECVPSNKLGKGWQSAFYSKDVFITKTAMDIAIQQIFDMTFKKPASVVWSMSLNFIANNTEIGCGYGTHVDVLGKTSLYLNCLTQYSGVSSSDQAYEVGKPCSNCDMWNEKCSTRYSGLCEPNPASFSSKQLEF